jgi:hypothetical protein
MFIGHFAIGLLARRAAPRAGLPVLLAAPQVLDMVFPVLVVAGVEQVAIAPGITAVSPLDLREIGWSHSLVTAIGWSIAFALGYLALTRQRREAIVLGACVMSHWVLDWITHVPDLPLYPGGPKLGLGLWHSLPGTLVVEGALFVAGVWTYATCTRARDRIGAVAWWALVATLVGMYLGAIFGPKPPDADALLVAAFGAWALLAWGWWIERHRVAA